MSDNRMDQLKNKIRSTGSGAVHNQLIDAVNTDSLITPPNKQKKKKFEDTHSRDTFWLKNEIKEQLDGLCKGERGEKTRIINEALTMYFEQM